MRYASLFAIALAVPALAIARSAPLTVEETTEAVLAAANQYAAAVSCVEIEPRPQTIAALVPFKNSDDRSDEEYVVFWSGDIGCYGGSGTVTWNITFVKVSVRGHFYVDPARSSPLAKFEFPTRGFERLVGNSRDTLVVDAAEFGRDDANCCPSLRARYTLRVDEAGNWRLVNKKPLPPKK